MKPQSRNYSGSSHQGPADSFSQNIEAFDIARRYAVFKCIKITRFRQVKNGYLKIAQMIGRESLFYQKIITISINSELIPDHFFLLA